MIRRAWKPENHKLDDAFFPVELCDLKFVYPAETDLFGKVVRTEDVLAEWKKAVAFVQKIKADTKEYYSQFGANAYAAMNVLTDFASYPKGLSGVNTVPFLQAKAGAWIDDFVEASAKPGFNMTSYLGVDAIEAATWYDSLTAA